MIKQSIIHGDFTPCLSLDIETLATSINAAVVELGVVLFRKTNEELIVIKGGVYNIPPRLYYQTSKYRVDVSTIEWWNTGSGRDLANMPNELSELSLSQQQALWEELLTVDYKAEQYFTRGVFDMPILANFIPTFNPVAEDFRCYHDIRTLHSIPKVKSATPKPKNSHNALVDAMHNIEVIAAAYDLKIRYEPQCRNLANLSLRTTSSL